MKITLASFQQPAVRPMIASARAYRHAAAMAAVMGTPALSRYFRGQMRLDARTAVIVARFRP